MKHKMKQLPECKKYEFAWCVVHCANLLKSVYYISGVIGYHGLSEAFEGCQSLMEGARA